jgi:hypothetical protein
VSIAKSCPTLGESMTPAAPSGSGNSTMANNQGVLVGMLRRRAAALIADGVDA